MTSFVQTRRDGQERATKLTDGSGDAGLGGRGSSQPDPWVALTLAGSDLPFWYSTRDLGFKPGDWYLRQATWATWGCVLTSRSRK